MAMKLENDQELAYTLTALHRMKRLRDEEANETIGDPSANAAILESTEAMIRKLEGQVADSVRERPERAA